MSPEKVIMKQCRWIPEVRVRLYFEKKIMTSALICFGRNTRECEVFDGYEAMKTFSTSATHELGGLGMYKSQPTTVGCYENAVGGCSHKRSETLTSNGWRALADHPE